MSQIIVSQANSSPGFLHWVFKEKKNKRLLWIAGIATILQFIIFKSLYPYADFFSDSYSYVFAASANLDISIWPIGYSKFLMAFHALTHSDTAVVCFQYFFLEVSCLYFFFTILYFYNPGRITRNILFIFLFVNPLFLYISNYINSDPLFAALSVLWICELLWIINRPRPYQLFTQAILLFLCFTIRNNAYYYPFITAIAFILSRQFLWRKVVGIALGILLIIPFILFERNASYELIGTRQFSLFTGWQLANNALYMRGQIQVDSTLLPTSETKELDRISRDFFAHLPPDFHDFLAIYVANFFIRESSAPLKKYFYLHYRSKDEYESVKDWGEASVVFEAYGKYLINKYPLSFARYFMLLNAKNYFFPPLEKLEVYNLGIDNVPPNIQDWFDYSTPEVTAISKDIQSIILAPFPYLFLLTNILFIGSAAWLFLKKRHPLLGRELRNGLILSSCFLIANFCFCVFATIIVLRYQFFPLIITLAFPLLLIEFLDKKEAEGKKASGPETGVVNLDISQLKSHY